MDLTEGEVRFLRAYRRTLDEAAAFRESGLAGREGRSDGANGRAVLRRLKSKRAALEEREAELDRPTLERVKAEIAHIAFDDIGRYLSFGEGERGSRCGRPIRGFWTPGRSPRYRSGPGGRSR